MPLAPETHEAHEAVKVAGREFVFDHREDVLEFFELDVSSDGDTDLKRVRVGPDGERSEGQWTMTRDGLGRLLDDLDPTS